MVYCKKCGAELVERAAYCQKCGAPVEATAPVLASWGERFIAWLIDALIIGAFLSWTTWPGFILVPQAPHWMPFVDVGLKNVGYFLYWMLMDGIYGQSIGKMVMRLGVTRLDGKSMNFFYAALESLGKAFLLPLDCIVGWFVFPAKRQRLFSYLAGTIVVRCPRS